LLKSLVGSKHTKATRPYGWLFSLYWVKFPPMQRTHFMALLALGWLACNDGIEVTTDITVPETRAAISLTELASYYADTLPCASCEGIFTELAILDDSTYFLSESYIGEQSQPLGSFGSFSREGDILTLGAADDSARRFKIMEDRIVQLDKDGSEMITGLDYSLEQTTQPDNPVTRPFLTNGFLKIENNQGIFQPCGLSKIWELISDNGVKEANRFFAKQAAKLTEGVFVRATIELQPANDSTGLTFQVKLNSVSEQLATGCQ
jgi:uncharacterized lipoprotein NlpE involved in copper resistance